MMCSRLHLMVSGYLQWEVRGEGNKGKAGALQTGTMSEGKFQVKEELEMAYKILRGHNFSEIFNYSDSFFG